MLPAWLGLVSSRRSALPACLRDRLVEERRGTYVRGRVGAERALPRESAVDVVAGSVSTPASRSGGRARQLQPEILGHSDRLSARQDVVDSRQPVYAGNFDCRPFGRRFVGSDSDPPTSQ